MARTIYRSDQTITALNAVEVTPNDLADLDIVTRSIYVGNAGNLKVTMAEGNTLIYVNLPVGWHPIGASRIWSTLTTANNIIAAW